ncbi:hypothetical protein [Massilia sp. PWRC2]|uniref:hypothetical protein n=1 Tax=Massilia sp. PWRC2 TaxID=2804626 RepID=UPI003CF4A04E
MRKPAAPKKTTTENAAPAPAPAKALAKPAVKAATRPAAKAAVKPAVKAAVKPAAKAAAKPVGKAAAKPAAAAVKAVKVIKEVKQAKVIKPVKPRAPSKVAAAEPVREKAAASTLVRDSFTMPAHEYEVLGKVKKACLKAGFEIKKSELLRIGVALISQMDMATLQRVLGDLPQLKTGRPKKA